MNHHIWLSSHTPPLHPRSPLPPKPTPYGLWEINSATPVYMVITLLSELSLQLCERTCVVFLMNMNSEDEVPTPGK